ncbi:hypothetical protein TYRP_018538 [Tyrophagus putrescentiae]|nr:hypothetical protein TYRP_018538 [Tyrophagus putrescentiae]
MYSMPADMPFCSPDDDCCRCSPPLFTGSLMANLSSTLGSDRSSSSSSIARTYIGRMELTPDAGLEAPLPRSPKKHISPHLITLCTQAFRPKIYLTKKY